LPFAPSIVPAKLINFPKSN